MQGQPRRARRSSVNTRKTPNTGTEECASNEDFDPRMKPRSTIVAAILAVCSPSLPPDQVAPRARVKPGPERDVPPLITSICVPDPNLAEPIGYGDIGGPDLDRIDCGDDLVQPCERFAECPEVVDPSAPRLCACVCRDNLDCEGPLVPMRGWYPTVLDGWTSVCEVGRCVWTALSR